MNTKKKAQANSPVPASAARIEKKTLGSWCGVILKGVGRSFELLGKHYYLLPVLAVVLERALRNGYNKLVRLPNSSVSYAWMDAGKSDAAPVLTNMALETWRFSFLIYSVCWLSVVAVSTALAWRKDKKLILLPIVLVASFAYANYRWNGKGFATTEPIISIVETKTAINLHNPLLCANVMMYSSVGLLVLAMVIVQYSSFADPTVHRLRCSHKAIFLLLIVYSIYVVAGIAHMQSWMSIPSAWAGQKSEVLALANGVSGIAGMKATLLLALVFLPAFYFNAKEVDKQAETFVPQPSLYSDIQKWKEANGLKESGIENLAKMIAIVAPAFANTIASTWAKLAGL